MTHNYSRTGVSHKVEKSRRIPAAGTQQLTNGLLELRGSSFRFTFVVSFCLYNKKNMLEDMNFMFEWQKQYLARSLLSLVRYCLPLEHKIHIFSPTCNILYIFKRNYYIFFTFACKFNSAEFSVWLELQLGINSDMRPCQGYSDQLLGQKGATTLE